MAGPSLLSDAQNSQLRIVNVVEDETVDEDGYMARDPTLDGSDAITEDLNFIMFGDTEETHTADGMGIATIHWSRSKLYYHSDTPPSPLRDGSHLYLDCQKVECSDAKMQIEAAEHLGSSIGPSLFFG